MEDFTRSAERQLGDFGQTAFFLGDGLQRAGIDAFFELFSVQNLNPYTAAKKSASIISDMFRATQFLVPNTDSGIQWTEIRNKLEVFVLVRNLSGVMGLSRNDQSSLADLVNRAYLLSPFKALWAVEGVGHYYADRVWDIEGAPQALLSQRNDLPTKSLLMLHAGMGLAFADRILGNLHSQSSGTEFRTGLEQFCRLCSANSIPGYTGAALESFGLVTREFYPELIPMVNPVLTDLDPEFADYFWHGIGRALYFSRAYFFPVFGNAWDAIEREPSSEMARRNATAGLAWAVTLVNMRQPLVMEYILRSLSQRLPSADAFKNGVGSAVIMRQDTTPNADFIKAFCLYRIRDCRCRMNDSWERYIASSCSEGINQVYPALKERHRLEQLFHVHSDSAFTVFNARRIENTTVN
jgi:hypothetical protein